MELERRNSIKPSMLTLVLLTSYAAAGAMFLTPALPLMAASFGISAEKVQLVVSIYLAGYAFGMLPYGPLANRFGRKPTLYLGICLAIVGGMISSCAGFFQIFKLLVLGRLITAIGASVGLKIAYTMVSDLYAGARAAKKISVLLLGFPIASMTSITVGGFLTQYIGWTGPIYAMMLYGFVLLFLSCRLPETALELDHEALHLKKIVRGYAQELFHLPMIFSALQVGTTCIILYVFAAKAPFLVINVLGLRPDQYGLLGFLPALGQATGLMLNIRLASRFNQLQIMVLGIGAINLAVILFALGFLVFGFSLATFCLPVPVLFFGNSIISSNTASYALSIARKKSYASALVNTLGLCVGSCGVGLSNVLDFQYHWVIPLFFGIVGLLALIWWIILSALDSIQQKKTARLNELKKIAH